MSRQLRRLEIVMSGLILGMPKTPCVGPSKSLPRLRRWICNQVVQRGEHIVEEYGSIADAPLRGQGLKIILSARRPIVHQQQISVQHQRILHLPKRRGALQFFERLTLGGRLMQCLFCQGRVAQLFVTRELGNEYNQSCQQYRLDNGVDPKPAPIRFLIFRIEL
jgi:hypothetical protein